MRERKPHILLLINDEHRPDVLPIEGNPPIRTPAVDRVIGGGFYFRNAHTPSPICVPDRQSFHPDRYSRRCGSLNFGDPNPSEVMIFPGHLSRSDDPATRAEPCERVSRSQCGVRPL